jgi:hypothetical protein
LASSRGACRSRSIAAIKFDFPDPFAPTRTLTSSSASVVGSGPKDSKFWRVIDSRNRAMNDRITVAPAKRSSAVDAS